MISEYAAGEIKEMNLKMCNYLLHRAGFTKEEISQLTLTDAVLYAGLMFVDNMMGQTNRALLAMGKGKKSGKSIKMRW